MSTAQVSRDKSQARSCSYNTQSKCDAQNGDEGAAELLGAARAVGEVEQDGQGLPTKATGRRSEDAAGDHTLKPSLKRHPLGTLPDLRWNEAARHAAAGVAEQSIRSPRGNGRRCDRRRKQR